MFYSEAFLKEFMFEESYSKHQNARGFKVDNIQNLFFFVLLSSILKDFKAFLEGFSS